jgi:hypothetical protein
MAYRLANATVAAYNAVVVTPSDVTVFEVTRALYIGAAGDLVVVMAEGTAPITFVGVSAGIFPVQVEQVYSTGTTAGSIVAMY